MVALIMTHKTSCEKFNQINRHQRKHERFSQIAVKIFFLFSSKFRL